MYFLQIIIVAASTNAISMEHDGVRSDKKIFVKKDELKEDIIIEKKEFLDNDRLNDVAFDTDNLREHFEYVQNNPDIVTTYVLDTIKFIFEDSVYFFFNQLINIIMVRPLYT